MLNSRMNSSLVVVSPQHVDTIGNASTCRRDLLLLGNPPSTRSLCSNSGMMNPARMQRQSGIRDMSVLEGVIAMPHLANHDFYSMKNRRSASIRSLSSGLQTEAEESKENATVTTATEDETSYSSFQRYPITPACLGGSQRSQRSLRSLLSPEGRHAFYSRNQRSQSQRSLISSLSSTHSSTADQLPTVPLGFHSTSQKNLFQSSNDTEGQSTTSSTLHPSTKLRSASSLGDLTEDEPLHMPQRGISNATFDRNGPTKPRLSVTREILSSHLSPNAANSASTVQVDLQTRHNEDPEMPSLTTYTMTPTRSKLVHRSKRDLFATSKSKSSSYLGGKQSRRSQLLSPLKPLTRQSLPSLPLPDFKVYNDLKIDEASLASSSSYEKENKETKTHSQQSPSYPILITPSKASKEEEEEEEDSIAESNSLSFLNVRDSLIRTKKNQKKILSLKDLNRNLNSFPKLPIDDSTTEDDDDDIENYREFFSESESFSCPTIVSRTLSPQQQHHEEDAFFSQLEADLMQLEGKVVQPTIVGRSSASQASSSTQTMQQVDVLSKIEFDLMQLEGIYEFGLSKIASIRRTLRQSLHHGSNNGHHIDDAQSNNNNLRRHDEEGNLSRRHKEEGPPI